MRKDGVVVAVSGGLLGGLAVLLTVLGNPPNMGLCVACFERDIAGALGLHGSLASAWIRPEIIGICLGAMLAAGLAGEYRAEGGSSPAIRFLLGMLMMIGALVFLGCPVRMMLRLGGGDFNAIVGLGGFAAGIAAGVWLLRSGFNLGRSYRQRSAEAWILPTLMGALLLAAVFVPQFKPGGPIHEAATGHPGASQAAVTHHLAGVAISLAAGLALGMAAQRSRLCMAGAFRDLMLIGSRLLFWGAVAVVLAALVGNLIAGRVKLGFADQPIAHQRHLWNGLGMMLVGLAAVMAGGCPLRQLVLAGAGNSDSALTVLGMISGAAVSHNFDLVAAATVQAKAAVLIGLTVALVVGLLNRERY